MSLSYSLFVPTPTCERDETYRALGSVDDVSVLACRNNTEEDYRTLEAIYKNAKNALGDMGMTAPTKYELIHCAEALKG